MKLEWDLEGVVSTVEPPPKPSLTDRAKSAHRNANLRGITGMPTKIIGVINDVDSNESDDEDKSDRDDDNAEDNLKGLPKVLKRDEEYDSSDDEDWSDNKEENKDDQDDDPPLKGEGEAIDDAHGNNESGSMPPSPLGRGTFQS